MADSDRILSEALIVRKVPFCVSGAVGGRRSRGHEVDGEVAWESVLGGGEGAALVVDWRAVEFHCCPEGLQVAGGEEGV